jgi:uncharacterized protein with von Willebrand factor type A (vWA) domain
MFFKFFQMKKITLLFSFLALCSTSIVTAQFNYSEEAEELLSVEPISNKNSVDVMIVLDCSGSMVGNLYMTLIML